MLRDSTFRFSINALNFVFNVRGDALIAPWRIVTKWRIAVCGFRNRNVDLMHDEMWGVGDVAPYT